MPLRLIQLPGDDTEVRVKEAWTQRPKEVTAVVSCLEARSFDHLAFSRVASATFALKLMFHKTHLFNRIIATSPSFEHSGKTIYDYHQDLAMGALPSKVRLFVSVGSLENTYSARARDFMRDLEERKFRNLQLHTMILDGFDHIAANFPGFIYGLRAVYAM